MRIPVNVTLEIKTTYFDVFVSCSLVNFVKEVGEEEKKTGTSSLNLCPRISCRENKVVLTPNPFLQQASDDGTVSSPPRLFPSWFAYLSVIKIYK